MWLWRSLSFNWWAINHLNSNYFNVHCTLAHVRPNVNNMWWNCQQELRATNHMKKAMETKMENNLRVVICYIKSTLTTALQKWTMNVCILYGITFLECYTSCAIHLKIAHANAWRMPTFTSTSLSISSHTWFSIMCE